MVNKKWEAWKQRIGDEYNTQLWNTLAADRLWITISDPETAENRSHMAGNTNVNFQSLSPAKKYNILTKHTNPQSINYTKTGTVNLLVTRDEAETLLTVQKLDEFQVTISKHKYKNQVRGIITNDVISSSSQEEIEEGLEKDGCVHVRMKTRPKRNRNKDNEIVRDHEGKAILEPAPSAIVTFERETLPDHVILFGIQTRVTQFEPEPMQCFRCFEFGKCFRWENNKRLTDCKAVKELCGWCSEEKHTNKSERCKNTAHCRNCSISGHPSFSKECPLYLKEKKILYIKETAKVPYPKAKEMAAQNPKQNQRILQSYADVMDTKDTRSDKLSEMLQASEEKWNDRFSAINNAVESLTKQTGELLQAMQLQMTQSAQQQTTIQAITEQTMMNQQILEETRALKASVANFSTAILRNQHPLPQSGPLATTATRLIPVVNTSIDRAAQQLQKLNDSLDDAEKAESDAANKRRKIAACTGRQPGKPPDTKTISGD